MRVTFRTNKLERQYQQSAQAERAYGRDVARRYIERINIMHQTRNLEELMDLPGLRCHALQGARRGEYSVRLTGFYRLIFSLVDEQIDVVRIEEVSKHYGD